MRDVYSKDSESVKAQSIDDKHDDVDQRLRRSNLSSSGDSTSTSTIEDEDLGRDNRSCKNKGYLYAERWWMPD